jgi:hypothetical protein
MFFIGGGLFGAFLFGETEKYFAQWYNTAGYYGRLTLDQVFHLPVGVVVAMVVFMALFMFWGAEQLERIFGKKNLKKEPKIRRVGAGLLAAAAIAIILIGQPSAAQKWARVAEAKTAALNGRSVQIHPGELLVSQADQKLNIIMLDVRSEADYNLFHIKDAQNVPLEGIRNLVPGLLSQNSANTIVVLMSNDEVAASEAWKVLLAESVPNVYILEGGINNWISIFGKDETGITPIPVAVADDQLRYSFAAALGDRYAASAPAPYEWKLEYTPRIQLQRLRNLSGGGCG